MKKIIEYPYLAIKAGVLSRDYIESIKARNFALLVKKDRVIVVKPDAEYFTLKELQKAVEGYIEIVASTYDGFVDVVNEEGHIKELYFNEIAYILTFKQYVGNVLICPIKILDEPEKEC